MLTAERARELFEYNPETGVFLHAKKKGNVRKGTVAGSPHGNGYVDLSADSKHYLAHRVAWLIMTGEWPASELDHKDRVRTNNAWDNLRVATRSQNLRNCNPRGESGIVGVRVRGSRFAASIRIDGKARYLGTYSTAEEAGRVYEGARDAIS